MKTRLSRKILIMLRGALICAAVYAVFPCAVFADGETQDDNAQIIEVETTTTVETTEPEMQQALNAADSDPINFESTETENAIQQAVDMALAGADGDIDVTSVTIEVGEGTYAGGINIDGSGMTLANDFVLEIVAVDAEDAGTFDNSAGGVEVDGPINVIGIDVLLAGLYLCTEGLVNAEDADVEFIGTEEDDDVTFNLSNDAQVMVDSGDGNDSITLEGNADAPTEMLTNNAVDTGDGDDLIVVDTSVADSSLLVVDVSIDGGDGEDKVELTGSLQSGGASTASEAGGIGLATLETETTNTVNVTTVNVEAHTDTLSNKNTVTVTGNGTHNMAALNLTDYFFDFNTLNPFASVDVTVNLPNNAFLSNFIIEPTLLMLGTLRIDNINAVGLNVVVTGEEITVNQNITARNITITAVDTDVMFDFSQPFDSGVIPDFNIQFSLYDFYTNANITIAAGAVLNASESIALRAESSQTQPLIPDPNDVQAVVGGLQVIADDNSLTQAERDEAQSQIDALNMMLANPNYMNIKVGNAKVNIYGELYAGTGVEIHTSALVDMEVTNEELAELLVPLCVNVAVTDASILMSGAGYINANGSVNMSTASDISMRAAAITGTIPIALALSVVVVTSQIILEGDSMIDTAGRVSMESNGTVSINSLAKASVPEETTENTNKSCGFFAVTVAVQVVGVNIKDNATIYADEIFIVSNAVQGVQTLATSDNEAEVVDSDGDGTAQEDDNFTVEDGVNIIVSLFKTVQDENMVEAQADGALEEAGNEVAPEDKTPEDPTDDKKGAADVLDAGLTGAADPAGGTPTTQSTSQVAGALAITYAGNFNDAKIDTQGNIEADSVLSLETYSENDIVTLADSTPESEDETTASPSVSIGVSVGIAVVTNFNKIYVSAGYLECCDLVMNANAKSVSSELKALTGITKCSNIGVAGGAAVHVIVAQTEAILASDVYIAGGDIEMTAEQGSSYTTEALASKDGSDNPSNKVGIGAGIAVSVIGSEANAKILDDADILMLAGTTTIGGITLSASVETEENTASKAGAAGGTSIVPVLTVIVSGAQTNAYLGASTVPLNMEGNVEISASTTAIRSGSADADASGNSGVALGGSFLIDIIIDGADSKLKRNLSAQNVGIYAQSHSVFEGEVKASASGAKSNSEQTQVAQPDPPNENEGEADEMADRSVGAAAALAGVVSVGGVGTAEVEGAGLSQNRQKAETSEGKVSIAAGFALNAQTNNTNAEICDGVTVIALPSGDENGKVEVISKNKTDASILANASAVGTFDGSNGTLIGVGVAVALNIVTYNNRAYIGDVRIACKSLSIISSMTDEEDEEEEEEEEDETFSLNQIITDLVTEFVMDLISELTFVDEFESITIVIEDLVAEIANDTLTIIQSGTGLENLFQGDIEELLSEKLDYIINIDQNLIDAAKQAVRDELRSRFDEMLAGNPITPFDTTSLDTALQGIAQSIVDDLTADLVDIDALRLFLQENMAELAKTKLRAIVEGALSTSLNTALKVLDGWIGSEAEELHAHTISTESIAGAGNAKIGVAGSVAVTVLVGNTTAQISDRTSILVGDINVAEHLEIMSDAVNAVSTVASSAVGIDGQADQNKDAESNSNGKLESGSEPAETNVEKPANDPPEGSGDPADPNTECKENTPTKEGASVGVGAACVVNFVAVYSNALIGEYREVTAGTIRIDANIHNRLEAVSVSGSDPLTGGNGTPAKTAVDASVAVGIIVSEAIARILANAVIMTTLGNVQNIAESDVEDVDLEELVNVYVTSNSMGETLTKASGFSVGASTAIGAAVVVNIAASKSSAEFAANGQISGHIKVEARTYNEDDANAIATAMGAKAQRYADKFNSALEQGETTINDAAAADGEYGDDGDADGEGETNNENQTQETINDKLDANKNSEQRDENDQKKPNEEKANDKASLSANVMITQDTRTEANPSLEVGLEAAAETGEEPQPADRTEGGTQKDTQQSFKLRLAAAVALNITIHESNAAVTGTITCVNMEVVSKNSGNFNAMGTGAAISLDGGNSIGLGIAVSLNKNESHSSIGGHITSTGDVLLDAQLTQNLDGGYNGLLAAQAIGGAVSTGDDSKVSIAGAVAVVISLSNTSAKILSGSVVTANNIEVAASDKSRLAVRAGALTASKSSVGMGISFALIFAHNVINAKIESGAAGSMTTINANTLKVSARKIKVDFSDFISDVSGNLHFPTILSTTKTVDEDNPDDSDEIYQVDITIDTDTILDSVSLLNFLSSTNYYAEAISGAATSGNSKFAMAGSLALVFFFNTTTAEIGDYVDINMLGTEQSIAVEAGSDTSARVIAGAVTAGKSEIGVGLTLGFIMNMDKAYAKIGSNSTIDTTGTLLVDANASMDMLIVTVAAAVTSGAAIGGSITFILAINDVQATIGSSTIINAHGGVDINASNDSFLLLLSLSVSASSGKAAVGGTIAFIISGNSAKIEVGNNTHITANNSHVSLYALDTEKLFTILASLSASSGQAAVAGTLGVQIAKSVANINVKDNARIVARNDITFKSESNVFTLSIMASMTGSSSTAVGGTINANLFTRHTKVLIGKNCYIQSTNGSIYIQALAKEFLLASVVAGGFSSSAAITGCFVVVVDDNNLQVEVGDGTEIRAEQGSIAVSAHLDSDIVVPTLALTIGSTGVGMTAVIVVILNTIKSIIGSGVKLYAGAAAPVIVRYGRPNLFELFEQNYPTKTVNGILVSASAVQNIVMFVVSGAGGTSAGVGGTLTTLVVANNIKAEVGCSEDGAAQTTVETAGDLEVDADDDAYVIDCAGGVAVGSSAGVGITIVILVFTRTMTAAVYENVTIIAARNVTVLAKAFDNLMLFSIAFAGGGSAGVAGDGNAVVYVNTVEAIVGGTMNISGNLKVSAETWALVLSMGVGMGVGGSAGVAAVLVITYFQSTARTTVLNGARLTAGGTISIGTVSREILVGTGAGIGGSGTAGVAGSVSLTFVSITTETIVEDNVHIAGSSVDILADDHYNIFGFLGSFGVSAVAGVGVIAMIAIVFSNVSVIVGQVSSKQGAAAGDTLITSTSTDVKVEAKSKREFDALLITAGGGQVGVSVVVAALIIGDSLIDDVKRVFYPDDDTPSYSEVDTDGDGYIDEQEKRAGTDINDPDDYPDEDPWGYSDGNFEAQATLDSMFNNKNVHQKAKDQQGTTNVETRLALSGRSVNDYQTDVDGAEDQNGDGTYDPDDDGPPSGGFAQTDPGGYDNMDTEGEGLSDQAREDDAKDNAQTDTESYIGNVDDLGPSNAQDAISAQILDGVIIDSNRDIFVVASDDLTLDLITVAVAVGLYAGVSVGVSIAVLFSNVVAEVVDGALLKAGRDVTVNANSGITEFDYENDPRKADKDSYIGNASTNNSDGSSFVSNSSGGSSPEENVMYLLDASVRMISICGGASVFAGVSVSVAAVLVFTGTHAIMNGDIYRGAQTAPTAGAQNLNVIANSQYGLIMNLALTMAAGIAGVGVGVSVSLYKATVESGIGGDALIVVSSLIDVLSTADAMVMAAGTALGGGFVAVNAGAAISINLTRVETYIGQGVDATAQNVLVHSDVTTKAVSVIIALAIGAGAFNVSLTVALLFPTVLTYIGVTPIGTPNPNSLTLSSSGGIPVPGKVKAHQNITVKNKVSGLAYTLAVATAGGMCANNGGVGLALNYIKGYAAVNKTNIEAQNLNVVALLDGNAKVNSYSAAIGQMANGLIVGIALIFSENIALINTTYSLIDISGTIHVATQDASDPNFTRYESDATVILRTCGVGVTAAYSVNIALALNMAENKAIVQGSGQLEADTLEIKADGYTRVYAHSFGITGGAISISLTVSLAFLESKQEARLSGAGTVIVNNLTVESRLNYDKAITTSDAEVLIFSGGGGLLTVMGQVGIAISDAQGIASVGAGSLTVNGDIRVHSYGRSNAQVQNSSVTFGAVSVGLVFGIAVSMGSFIAEINTKSDVTKNDAQIDADNIDVLAQYNSFANTIINPSVGYFDLSLANVDANVAVSYIETEAEARVVGGGAITFNGDFDVTVTGNVSSYAEVVGALLSANVLNIAINVVDSRLKAEQKAYIEDSNVISKTGMANCNVNVTANFNLSPSSIFDILTGFDVDAARTSNTAYAVVGNNSTGASGSISLISGEVNVSTAKSQSQSYAYIEGGSIDISGIVSVHSYAQSQAFADLRLKTASTSAANIGAFITTADAAGTYKAYIDSTGSSMGITADSIDILTDYDAYSIAYVGNSGSGLDLGGLSIKVNKANAYASVNASAYVKGTGSIKTLTSISIKVDGDGKVKALIKPVKVSISVADVFSNTTYAKFNATQKAYVSLGTGGQLSAQSGISIVSLFNKDSGQSDAELMNAEASCGNKFSTSVTLGSISDSKSTALTKTTNKAAIEGSGTITIHAGSLLVRADGYTNVLSKVASGTSVSAFSFGGVKVYAYTKDTVSAYIKDGVIVNVHTDNPINTSKGNVTITANAKTDSKVNAVRGTKITMVSGSTVDAIALVGYKNSSGDYEYQTVESYIGNNAEVNADRDITISAMNEGKPVTIIDFGTTISAFTLAKGLLRTKSYYKTTAKIGNNAKLYAGRNITITSDCKANALTYAQHSTFGGLQISDYYAYNYIKQLGYAKIGNSSMVLAEYDITIKSQAQADMRAETRLTSAGLAGVAELKAENHLVRTLNTTIGSNSTIDSQHGAISIASEAGLNDSITTIGVGTGAGLAGIGTGDLRTNINSNAITSVGAGTKITNTFGEIKIAAYNGIHYLFAKLDMDAGGLGADTHIENYSTTMILNAKVTIGTSGGAQAEITGKYINIYALLKEFDVNLYTKTVVSGLGAVGKSYGKVWLNSTILVDIYDAVIRGYDNVRILALVDPSGGLTIHTHSTINAFAGSISAYSYFYDNSSGIIKLNSNVDIYGAYVYLNTCSMNLDVYLYAGGKRRAIASKYTGKDWIKGNATGYSYRSKLIVDSDVDFYIGDAVAGVVIRINEDNTVDAVGIAGGKQIWTVGANAVTFTSDFANAVPGRLIANNQSLGGADVYTQEYLSYIRVINKSQLDIEMGGAKLYNDSFTNPLIFATNYTLKGYDTEGERPTEGLTIQSHYDTDVTLGVTGGIVFCQRRKATIEWVDPLLKGSLYSEVSLYAGVPVSTLWAHDFEVINVDNIGLDENNRFTVYLTVNKYDDGSGEVKIAPDVNLTAAGNIYISLTLAETTQVSQLSSTMDTTPLNVELLINSIIAGGVLDLELPMDVRLEYLGGQSGIMLIFPGMVKYSEDYYVTSTDKGFTGLATYQTGFNPADDSLSYELPDGTLVYADSNGKITRIVEKDAVILNPLNYEETIAGYHDVGKFSIINNELIFSLDFEGISINLTDGTLTVLDDNNSDTDRTFAPYIIYNGPQDAVDLAYATFQGDWNIVSVATIEVERIMALFALAEQDDGTGTMVDIKTDYATIEDELTFWKTDSRGDHYILLCPGDDREALHNFETDHFNVIVLRQGAAISDYKIEGAYKVKSEYVSISTADSNVITFELQMGTILDGETTDVYDYDGYYYIIVEQYTGGDILYARAKIDFWLYVGGTYDGFRYNLNMTFEFLYYDTVEGYTYITAKEMHDTAENYLGLDIDDIPSAITSQDKEQITQTTLGWVYSPVFDTNNRLVGFDNRAWTDETPIEKTNKFVEYYDPDYNQSEIDQLEIDKQDKEDALAIETDPERQIELQIDIDNIQLEIDALTAEKDRVWDFYGYYFDDDEIYLHDETLIKYFWDAGDVSANPDNYYEMDLVSSDTRVTLEEDVVYDPQTKLPTHPVYPLSAMIYKTSPALVDTEWLQGGAVHLHEGDTITLSEMEATVAGTTVYGYMLTQNVFIAKDGTVYFGVEFAKNTSPALDDNTYFDVANNIYDDGEIRIEGTDDSNTAVVTIYADSTEGIRYEQLTANVAKDCEGLYYRWDISSSMWVLTTSAYVSHIGAEWVNYVSMTIMDVEEVYDADGTTVLVTIITLNDGTEDMMFYLVPTSNDIDVLLGEDGSVLVIGESAAAQKTELQQQDYYIGYLEGTRVVIKMWDPQGDILDDNNAPLGATSDDANPSIDIRASERVIFMADSTGTIGLNSNKIDIESPIIDYLDLNGDDVITTDTYLTAMSMDTLINDGRAFVIKGAHFQVIGQGCDLYYGKIDVIANTFGDRGYLEIIANNGRILPVNMDPNTDITDPDINGIITLDNSDAHLTADGDIVMNHFSAGNNSIFNIVSRNGSAYVYAEDSDAIAEGYLRLDASTADITAFNNVSYNEITTSGISILDILAQNGAISNIAKDHENLDYMLGTDCSLSLADTTAVITAAATFIYNEFTIVDSWVDVTAGGHINLFDAGSFINIDPSTVKMSSGGDFNYHRFDSIDSDVDIDARDNINLLNADSYINIDGGISVDFTAGENMQYNELTVRNCTCFTAEATRGAFSLVDEHSFIWIEGSGLAEITAGLDITYHEVDAINSNLAMRSTGANIRPFDAESRVIVVGDTSGLTLSALYDIAYENMHMFLDIPEAVTLQIEFVTNYWIDAVHWPIYVPSLPSVFEGWNEFAEWVENLGLIFNEHVEYINSEDIVSLIADIPDIEWAQMIIDAMLRSEWLAIVNLGSIEELIANEEIDSAWLSTWLEDDTITEEFVRTHLDNLINFLPGDVEYDDAAAWLTQMEADMRDAIENKDPLVMVPPVDPNDPVPFAITDAMVNDLLVLLLHEDEVQRLNDLTDLVTTEIIEQKLMNIAARIAAKLTEELNPDDQDARDINIHVGESVGSTYVTNEGSIIITQDMGTMTLDLIDSTRENVTLSALGGHIQSIPDPNRAVIYAKDIWMYALYSIGHYNFHIRVEQMTSETIMVANILDEYLDLVNVELVPDNPLTPDIDETLEFILGLLTSSVRFDWVRILDPYAPTNLYAYAETGSIYMEEETGQMGLNFIGAGIDANIWAHSIVDTRNPADLSVIVSAGNSLYIEVDEDGIGTSDDYFGTIVGHNHIASDPNAGITRIIAPDDIFMTDLVDTILKVTTNGHVNVETQGSLALENMQIQGPFMGSMNLLLGYVEALGFAYITSIGEIIEGERRTHPVTVRSNGMYLRANGNIGYRSNPFEIDMLGGDFSAYADQVIVDEYDADIVINQIVSLGDVVITAPGMVLSNDLNTWNMAAYYQWMANTAQNEADASWTLARIMQEHADSIRKPYDDALALLDAAQSALDAANLQKIDLLDQLALATDPGELTRLQKLIDALDDTILLLTKARDEAQTAADAVWAQIGMEIMQTQMDADMMRMMAEMSQMDANMLQMTAEMVRVSAMSLPITITSDGNLDITAGQGIGEFYSEISTDVAGTMTLLGGAGGVHIAGAADMNIIIIRAQQIVTLMNMSGHIQKASGGPSTTITGDVLYLFSLGRDDIGRLTAPLQVITNELLATGENVYIDNIGALGIGQIDANGDVRINATGDITVAWWDGEIAGSNVIIRAGGNVGSGANPLVINSDKITIAGRNVAIMLLSYLTSITKVAGRKVTIESFGNIRGGIVYAMDLMIRAEGEVYREEDPLYIYVSHIIDIKSTYYDTEYGVHYINLYPFLDDWLNRQLEEHYLAIYAIAIPYLLPEGVQKTLYMLIGLKEDGTWDVLGFWAFAEGDSFEDIVQNLIDRGVQAIDLIFIDGRGSFTEAFQTLFPQAHICINTYLWVLNGRDISEVDEEFEEMTADLRTLYETQSIDEANVLFDEFMRKWSAIYPEVTEHLDTNWQCYLDAFEAAQDMREAGFDLEFMQWMIDTMAAAIMGRGVYPNDTYFFQSMFDIMVSFFPSYKTEIIVE